MGVSEKVTLKILSDDEMKKMEEQVVKLEALEKRKVKATAGLKNRATKPNGIFSSTEGQEALPSNIVRKRRKLKEQSILGRGSDSLLAGLDKSKDKKSAAAVVKASEFTKLQNQVNANEKVLSLFNRGQGFLSGAAGLTTSSGIVGTALGLANKIPFIGAVIGVATAAAERYVAQHAAGGTRDTRVKVLDDDVSDIGIETESDIDSGRKLFLSNPLKNQGLPGGRSNTQSLRDGTRIYKLKREGTYT